MTIPQDLDKSGSGLTRVKTNFGPTLGWIDTYAEQPPPLVNDTIYYRDTANTWAPVIIGNNLSFNSGVLSAPGGGLPEAPMDNNVYGRKQASWVVVAPAGAGTGNVISVGTPTVNQLAQWTTATSIKGIDISSLGFAPINSPTFTGTPTGPTAVLGAENLQLATTEFVTRADSDIYDVLVTLAPINGPVFTGTPQAPTPLTTDNSTAIATTKFVKDQGYITSAAVSGVYQPLDGDLTALSNLNGVNDIYYRSGINTWSPVIIGANMAFSGGILSSTGGGSGGIPEAPIDANVYGRYNATWAVVAPLASPAFTGNPTAPTLASGDNTTGLATTAFVQNKIAGYQPLDGDLTTISGLTGVNTIYYRSGIDTWSPVTFSGLTFAGGELAVTAGGGNVSNSGTPAVGELAEWVTSTSIKGITKASLGYAPLASPAFTGTPTAPTPASNDTSTTLATTAFVRSNLGAYVPITGGTMIGDLAIEKLDPSLVLSRNSGSTASIKSIRTSTGLLRWRMVLGVGTEPGDGTDVGGNFALERYGDTGSLIGTPIQIIRQTGAMNLANATLIGTAASSGPGTPFQVSDTTESTGIGSGALKVLGGIGVAKNINAGGTVTGAAISSGAAYKIGANTILSGGGNLIAMYDMIGRAIMTHDVASNFVYHDCNTHFFRTTAPTLASVASLTQGETNLYSTNVYSYAGLNFFGKQYSATPINTIVTIGFHGINNHGISLRTQVDGAYMILFYSAANANVGYITSSASTTTYATASDGRLKDDLKEFDAGPTIDAIKVHDFRWKNTGERAHGVIAQEAIDVYPQAITHSDKEDLWGADYSKFVPLLLQEVKALRKRVAELERK